MNGICGMSLDRRAFLLTAAALGACVPVAKAATDRFAASPWRKLTPADWKKRLPPASFEVLREGGTEAPFSSSLDKFWGRGTYVCLGCGLPLFKSAWKFESGTGWPSFYTAIPGALAMKADYKLIEPRTEYHCAQCLGHQGHVFHDGPRPTGLRYCNDGVALKFVAG
ncbi:MAG: peptide-methionine (R)-S-oxide reductase MsrB [Caulobacteraceae bacterium]